MGIASYLRFGIGIILSTEVIRQLLFGKEISSLATILSIAFLFLAAWFFVEKLIIH